MKNTIPVNELPVSDAAEIGKMTVTSIRFDYNEAGSRYVGDKYQHVDAYWNIRAELVEKNPRGNNRHETMSINVERGIGQKLVEVLLPVIVADASRKAQQMADDSKAMLVALGDKTILSLTQNNETTT